jgi:hypothetical protein
MSIVIPKSVNSIDDNAFTECINLRIVYNLSNLNIAVDSGNYGSVASNASFVFDSADHTESYYDDGEYYFLAIDDEWYLYKTPKSVDSMVLPESFTYNGKEITSYTILKNSMYPSDYVVIPTAVKKIDDDALIVGAFDVVYYGGTSSQWQEIYGNLRYNSIYYYSNCVHYENGHWTYVDGEIVTVPSFKQVVTKQPTCTERGYYKAYCNYCGDMIQEGEIEVTAHSYGSDGKCVHCGTKKSDEEE